MAERIVNPRPRLMPQMVPTDEAPSDPTSQEQDESLASLAALSGVALTNRAVSAFIGTFSNAAMAQIQAATQ